MQLVTVYQAFNPVDAHRVRAQLEAAGFHATVMHELSALSMDGYSMGAGGVLVQVPDAEAKEFLETPAAPTE